MSIWVTKTLLAFYVVLFFSCLYDKKYEWALYFVGAFILTIAILLMMLKK